MKRCRVRKFKTALNKFFQFSLLPMRMQVLIALVVFIAPAAFAQDSIDGGPPAPVLGDPDAGATALADLCSYQPECVDFKDEVIKEFVVDGIDKFDEEINSSLSFVGIPQRDDRVLHCTITGTPQVLSDPSMALISATLLCDPSSGWALGEAEMNSTLEICADNEMDTIPGELFQSCKKRVSGGSLRYGQIGNKRGVIEKNVSMRTEATGTWYSTGLTALHSLATAKITIQDNVGNSDVTIEQTFYRPDGILLEEFRAETIRWIDGVASNFVDYSRFETDYFTEVGSLASSKATISSMEKLQGQFFSLEYKREYEASRNEQGASLPATLDIDVRSGNGVLPPAAGRLNTQWNDNGLISLFLNAESYHTPLSLEQIEEVKQFLSDAQELENEHAISSQFPSPPIE